MENYPKHYKTQGLLMPYLMLWLMILKKKHLKRLKKQKQELRNSATSDDPSTPKNEAFVEVKMARGTSLAILINSLRAEVGHSIVAKDLGKATKKREMFGLKYREYKDYGMTIIGTF